MIIHNLLAKPRAIFFIPVNNFRSFLTHFSEDPDQAVDRVWSVVRLYCFSLTCLSVLLAKCLHIYSHLLSLPFFDLLLFGPTLFLQDFIFIGIAHYLSRRHRSTGGYVFSALLAIFVWYAFSHNSQALIVCNIFL